MSGVPHIYLIWRAERRSLHNTHSGGREDLFYIIATHVLEAAVTPPCKLPVFLSDARAVDFAHE